MKNNGKLDVPILVFDLNMRLGYVGIIQFVFHVLQLSIE